MDSVRSGSYGQLFRPDNFVFGEHVIIALIIFFSYLDIISFILIIYKSDCILVSSYSRTKV